MSVLEVRNLTRNYRKSALKQSDDDIKVLKGLNFTVEEGEFLGIMGKSGCGKTTLLKVLGMIDKPTDGTIRFMGRDTSRLYGDMLADIRRKKIGFIFQDFYLMSSLSVRENMILPMALGRENAKKMMRRAERFAKRFQISHLLNKNPYELSGGEKQRVAICRALINNPDLILADEPTGNLDSKSGEIVIHALKKINQDFGKTIVMVTHDPQMASYCSRIFMMKDGMIFHTLEAGKNRDEFYQEIVEQMIYLQYNKKIEKDRRNYRFAGNSTDKQKLFYDDIICISKIKGTKYVEYVTVHGKYRELVPLEQLESELDSNEFVLVSRGILVNMRHIRGLQGNMICMDNEMQVAISRAKGAKVKEQIHEYWENR